MAGSFKDAFEVKILDAIFRTNTGVTVETALGLGADKLYIGLYTTTPSDSAAGTEVTGGSYARVEIDRNLTGAQWDAPAGSPTTTSNSVVLNFPTATANWGTVNGMAIHDLSSGGVQIMWADLTVAKAVNNGDTASFAIGDIDVTLD